jgi:hypothetical protein
MRILQFTDQRTAGWSRFRMNFQTQTSRKSILALPGNYDVNLIDSLTDRQGQV